MRFLQISRLIFHYISLIPWNHRHTLTALIDRNPIKIQYVSVNTDERRLPWIFYYLFVHNLYASTWMKNLSRVSFLRMMYNGYLTFDVYY